MQLTVEQGPDAAKALFRTMRTWWGNAKDSDTGLLSEGLRKDSAERIIQALQRSEEYAESVGADGRIITADEKLAKFLRQKFGAVQGPNFCNGQAYLK